jgi:site-specific DNA recombinase
MRAVIYARYSSENQRHASIEDQVRVCKVEITRRGCKLVQVYSDHAISGATDLRPGYQALMQDARSGQFDVVVAEALDRLSRDQESIAGLFKRLSFSRVRLITISEGEINELHVGLKGTMNALFLKDLALKTHRGLEGRIRSGKSAGGRAFGYDIVRQFGEDGQPVAGLRKVNTMEAETVKRIFAMFAAGSSPRAIARILNEEGIAGPGGQRWSDTTIRGHSSRRTGILRNDLYQGKLVWNKQRYVKDPNTGRRLARPNPKESWIWNDADELRIVCDELWKIVQRKLEMIADSPQIQKVKATKFWEMRRPKHLLTGIAVCGECGGPLTVVGKDYLACSSARRTGKCHNKRSIRRSQLEDAVLGVLRDNLLQPHLVEEFIAAYHAEINRKASEASAVIGQAQKRALRLTKEIDALVDILADGRASDAVLNRLTDLEAEKAEIQQQIAAPAPTPIRLHPRLPAIYRAKVEKLSASLANPTIRDEAAEIIRSLIERVKVTPTTEGMDEGMDIEVRGEIQKLLRFSDQKTQQNQCSVKVVAGAGFEPTTFRL